jgi:hypothetical protein
MLVETVLDLPVSLTAAQDVAVDSANASHRSCTQTLASKAQLSALPRPITEGQNGCSAGKSCEFGCPPDVTERLPEVLRTLSFVYMCMQLIGCQFVVNPPPNRHPDDASGTCDV